MDFILFFKLNYKKKKACRSCILYRHTHRQNITYNLCSFSKLLYDLSSYGTDREVAEPPSLKGI